MTRHRRHDPDEVNGDAPFRAPDYERPARPPENGRDYYQEPWGGGTSGGHDGGAGGATGPPWQPPAWNQPGTAGRPRDDGAHPSGPLPRLPAEAGPPTISGPLPPVPGEPWPAERGSYPSARHENGSPGPDDTGYLRTGSGYGGEGYAGGEYPAHDASGGPGYGAGYDDRGYGDSFAAPGGQRPGGYAAAGGDYATGPGYGDEPGYQSGPGYAGEQGYPEEHGYPGHGHAGGDGYPAGHGYAGDGYARDDDYPGQDGYAEEPGYPGHDGYPPGRDDGYPAGQDVGYPPGQHDGYPAGQDDGYPAGHDAGYHGREDTGYQPADGYLPGHDQPPDQYRQGTREDPDDHGYDGAGWYDDDVDEDPGWGDDEYEPGLLPGLGDTGDPGRAPDEDGPPRDRGGRRPPPGRARKRKSPMRRAAPWIALTVLVVVLAVAGTAFYYVWHTYLHPPDYSGQGTGTVVVHIESGETATQVGQQLLNLGVVASARAFSNAAKASGHGSSLEPGYYRLHKHMAAALAFAMLLKPSSRVQFTVTIPEGLRLGNIIAVLGKKTGDLHGYQQAIKETSSLGLPSYAHGNPEGYLFPATYTLQPGLSPLHVLQEMVQAYNQEATSVNLAAVSAHDQITEAQAIVVASLVQAEGRRPLDFPKIARVIYNRLNARMPLQLDSTVMYALNRYGIRATGAQTKIPSPYNTYQHIGLPPGPIDSPGNAAIQAALHPLRGHHDWLYFLTVNPKTGLTKFTSSYAQFQTYEAELNANLAKG